MAKTVSCVSKAFSGALMEMVSESVERNQEALDKRVGEAAKLCAKICRQTAPVKSGIYAKSWRAKKKIVGYQTIAVTYNSKRPGLTHLLEFGHELIYFGTPTGTRTRAFPHIAPAYEEAAEFLIGGK